MRRSLFLVIGAVLILGVLATGVFYYLERTSPRWALLQMAGAIKARNYEKFHHYLDLKSIVSHLVQETGQDLIPREDQNQDPLNRLGKNLARKFAQHLVPRLFEQFDQELRQVINKYLDTLTNKEILALEAAAALAEVSRRGEEAQVTIRVPQEDLRLRLTMSRNYPDRGWRVVAINYQDLKKFLKKELL